MLKLLSAALVCSAMCAAPALAQGTPRSGANSPTTENNASCMAQARAQYNSTGGSTKYGDRTKGGFGEAQSEFAEYLELIGSSFGEWLQDSAYASRETCPE